MLEIKKKSPTNDGLLPESIQLCNSNFGLGNGDFFGKCDFLGKSDFWAKIIKFQSLINSDLDSGSLSGSLGFMALSERRRGLPI